MPAALATSKNDEYVQEMVDNAMDTAGPLGSQSVLLDVARSLSQLGAPTTGARIGELEERLKQAKAYADKLSAQVAEKEALEKRVQELTAQVVDKEALEKRVEQLSSQVKTFNDMKNARESQMDVLDGEKKTLVTQLQSVKATGTAQLKQIVAQENEIKRLKQQIESFRRRNTEVITKLNTIEARGDYAREKKAFEDLKSKWFEEKNAAEKDLAERRAAVTKDEKIVAQLKDQSKFELQDSIDALSKALIETKRELDSACSQLDTTCWIVKAYEAGPDVEEAMRHCVGKTTNHSDKEIKDMSSKQLRNLIKEKWLELRERAAYPRSGIMQFEYPRMMQMLAD
jgi:chromosome segregation ATPase